MWHHIGCPLACTRFSNLLPITLLRLLQRLRGASAAVLGAPGSYREGDHRLQAVGDAPRDLHRH